MAAMRDPVYICKDEQLGTGSFGAVYKANWNHHNYAAKIIHPTLVDVSSRQDQFHKLPIQRFHTECSILQQLKHQNIVKYCHTYCDPDTGLPVLLMELLHENLTKYLEHSKEPVDYHIQVNICHDIAEALVYLHTLVNPIIHRDLTGKNVLLTSSLKAKISDFGMARLLRLDGTQSLSSYPGTCVYMPPEALEEHPRYTQKLDCFSFGVIIVQILTRKFPKPGNRHQQIAAGDQQYPDPEKNVVRRIPEIERRQNHIREVMPQNHPLLQIALECLEDQSDRRPTAHELCERLLKEKETVGYLECKRIVHVKEQQIQEMDRKIQELRGQQYFRIQWSDGREAPEAIKRDANAIVNHKKNKAYFLSSGSTKIMTYDYHSNKWSLLKSECCTVESSLAIINGSLTTIGGLYNGEVCNHLYSLRDYQWIQRFPDMQVGRTKPTTLCIQECQLLIVAGGFDKSGAPLKRVDVLKTNLLHLIDRHSAWNRVADLPVPLTCASATLCNDQIYILGGNTDSTFTRSVFTIALTGIRQGVESWSEINPLCRHSQSTCVTANDHLLVVGGFNETTNSSSKDVCTYDTCSNAWRVVSQISIGRTDCFVAVLPDGRVMVVGGQTTRGCSTNRVEFGTLHYLN